VKWSRLKNGRFAHWAVLLILHNMQHNWSSAALFAIITFISAESFT
jgi:hypothetical protein